MSKSLLDPGQIIQEGFDQSLEAHRVTITGNVVITSGTITTITGTVVATALVDGTDIEDSGGDFFEIIASTSSNITAIQVFDTTGSVLEIGTGAASAETRKFLIGPGADTTISVSIPSGTRISVRSTEVSAPTSGTLALNFIG